MLGHPPAWLAAALIVAFGLVLSAPAAVAAAWLFDRIVERRMHT